MRRNARVLVTIVWSVLLVLTLNARSNEGQFLDPLDIRDTGHDRDFVLLARFRYIDPNGVTWVVPVGTVVNGASIPRPLWSLIGGPWDGPYRRASVVHDYFFAQKKYASADVHKVFYDAMRTDKVAPVKAKLMYYAVVRFNKRWKQADIDPFECNRLQAEAAGRVGGRINCRPAPVDTAITSRIETIEVPFDAGELKTIAQKLESEDVPLEEVARIAEANYALAPKTVTSVEYLRP